MKKLKFVIDKSKKDPIQAISLVGEPAIESNFIAFNSDKQKPKFFKKEGYEQCVSGLALIPDRDILRENDGKYYVATFSKDVVKELSKLFFKNNNNNNFNLNHSKEDAQTYVFESFILDSDERVKDAISRGIPEADAVNGSWFITAQIEDPEVFQKVLDGDLNGFSIEAWLKTTLVVEDDTAGNNFSKTIIEKMSNKIDKMIDGLKQLLADVADKEPTAEVKLFESAKTADGVAIEYTVTGETVNKVAEDGTKAALEDGTYDLDNSKKIEVKDGLLVTIADVQVQAEKVEQAKVELSIESVAKFLKEKFGSNVFASYTLADGSEANVTVSEVNEVASYVDGEKKVFDAGEYPLKDGGKLIVGDGGKFVSVDTATVDITDTQDAQLAKEFSKINDQIVALKAETDRLKAENEVLKKAPLAKAIVKTEDFKKKKEIDFNKLSNADKLRYNAGIL